MDSIEIYHEERAEASPEARLDFPTYNEWMHNLCDPHVERIRGKLADLGISEDDVADAMTLSKRDAETFFNALSKSVKFNTKLFAALADLGISEDDVADAVAWARNEGKQA